MTAPTRVGINGLGRMGRLVVRALRHHRDSPGDDPGERAVTTGAAETAGATGRPSTSIRSYAVVTGGYWAFTVTDGALRMLVLLQFHQLGYSPVSIAFLFLLYEAMGVATNLVGGWVGSRAGLNRTLVAGLGLQLVALSALTLHRVSWGELISVAYVMGLQALSGVAKDLTKMSSKSAVKLVAGDGDGALFRLVALLTGSKNALKGVGFFVGAALLSWLGYDGALWSMAGLVAVALVAVLVLLDEDLGRSKRKRPLRSILSPSVAVNRLAAARVFLFGARDIWFVVALPVFLDETLGWSFEGIGAFLAAWIIGYGLVQSLTPRLRPGARTSTAPRSTAATSTGPDRPPGRGRDGELAEVHLARWWALALAALTATMAALVAAGVATTLIVVGGLIAFGVVFAVNSSVHSYLVLAYAGSDDVALDVGFYYSANATGRLVGTLLSGVLYLVGGLPGALLGSACFTAVSWLLSLRLPTSADGLPSVPAPSGPAGRPAPKP